MKAERVFVIVVVGGTLLIATIALIYQGIVAFYQAHTFWFWFIIAVIIISPICYFLRFKIMEMFYHIFNRKKPNNALKN